MKELNKPIKMMRLDTVRKCVDRIRFAALDFEDERNICDFVKYYTKEQLEFICERVEPVKKDFSQIGDKDSFDKAKYIMGEMRRLYNKFTQIAEERK